MRQRRPIEKRGRPSRLEGEAMANFKLAVFARDGGRCIGATAFASQHECDGPLQAHHCIRQQILRTHISTLELTEEERVDWLWSPDIGATVCESLHAGHTSAMHRIPLEWLPVRAIDFAYARGVLHLLEREHPPLFTEGDCP